MLNSATLTAILVNILAALFFTCITICIATHFAKKKANEADKKLINNKCYGIIAVIFTIINFIASFTAIAVAYVADSGDYNHLSIGQFSYLSLIFVAGVVEFFIAKSTIFQRFSCSKADKTERAAVFAAICAPYYIFIVSSPIVPYIIAVTLYPC